MYLYILPCCILSVLAREWISYWKKDSCSSKIKAGIFDIFLPRELLLEKMLCSKKMASMNCSGRSCFIPPCRKSTAANNVALLDVGRTGQRELMISVRVSRSTLQDSISQDFFMTFQRYILYLYIYYIVVSNIFYVHSYLGKWSNLTNIL